MDAPPLPSEARLRDLSQRLRVRLIEALDDTYPVLHAVLGDEVFESLGAGIRRAHPSVHRSIRWYGSELAAFLEAAAALRRAADSGGDSRCSNGRWRRCSTPPDASPRRGRALRPSIPPSGASSSSGSTPRCGACVLQWNTAAVWQAMSREQTPPAPAVRARSRYRGCYGGRICRIIFVSMPADEAAALDAALRGREFRSNLRGARSALPDEEIPLRAAGLLAGWTADLVGSIDSGLSLATRHAPAAALAGGSSASTAARDFNG